MTGSEKIDKFPCPGCGLVCDDITVKLAQNGEVDVIANACVRGIEKIREYGSKKRLNSCRVKDDQGEFLEVSYEEAISKAAELIKNAKSPIFYGWSSSSCEAQQEGIKLAQDARGIIDGTSSVCQGHFMTAMMAVGGASCTLGDVVNKADVVVFWGANPQEAHPRLVGRAVFSRGMFRTSGKEMKKFVTIDVRPTATSHANELFLQVNPGEDYEILSALRSHIETRTPMPEMLGGVPSAKWKDFVEFLENAEYPVFFVGLGLTASQGGTHNLEAILSFAKSLETNRNVQSSVIFNAGHYNMLGFSTVLASATGYPFGVDFRRDESRFIPGETTFGDLIDQDQIDLACIVASDPVTHLPAEAARRLVRKKLIAIDYQNSLTCQHADVVIPCTISGIEHGGTAVRLDGVPIPLKSIGSPPDGLKSDKKILHDLREKLKEPGA